MTSLQSILLRVLLIAAAAAPQAAAASVLAPTPQPTPTASSTATSSAAPSLHELAKADDTTVPVITAATTITRAPALPSTTAVYTSAALFTSAVLNSTNTYRRQHNATAVAWNATLAAYAAAYLANDTACVFAHSGGPYGENIAIGFASPRAAVEAWGNERATYDFDHPGFHESTGHFTQLVWKTTTAVGCAHIFCGGASAGQKNTGWFLACEYWPRGNVLGRFGQEVDRQTTSTAPGGGGGGGGGGGSASAADRPPTVSGGVITGAVLLSLLLATAFFRDVMDAVAAS